MTLSKFHHRSSAKSDRGFTLMELIVATTILSILTLMALPLARVTVQREREKQLRRALWEMRDGIDRYKEAADRQLFQTKVDSQNYPPDLETLVKGIEGQGGKKGAYAQCRTISTRIHGADKMSSTFTPSRKARASTARSTKSGNATTHKQTRTKRAAVPP